jgi:hypothetical protein
VRHVVQSRQVPAELRNRVLQEIEELMRLYLDPPVPYEPHDLIEPAKDT